ncbi:TIGR00730 family Rossman fold protein [Herbaspirillum sp. RTI4]|uniref:LOG family protein n=1 Tax=Herbaspirillum sp. RTI4 TaxID=3048640 RepID=UPI002AB4D390|nr:TIGR00730 family Rossman fold protein [Herbaspirillum sp. RTI4]MDY7578046.1 TIGR00730 family Rossman fold protein [Herbaspirillum sp. RTI4]MEA9983176.1 TIGR00730 family Rossman fold protein [Herbaspirillum sp. RTI4]
MKSICVYCGSSPGASPVYAEAARALAGQMVQENIALVYGGGNVGLMGIVASEVMRLGGQATGVIPHALLDKELGHHGLTELHVVKDMHERKALMAELSDGFIAMPGGMGTLEELFEVLTWAQLGFHAKPVALFNVDGFYGLLIAFMEHMVTQRFVSAEQALLMMHETDAVALITRLQQFTPTYRSKWHDPEAVQNLLP